MAWNEEMKEKKEIYTCISSKARIQELYVLIPYIQAYLPLHLQPLMHYTNEEGKIEYIENNAVFHELYV